MQNNDKGFQSRFKISPLIHLFEPLIKAHHKIFCSFMYAFYSRKIKMSNVYSRYQFPKNMGILFNVTTFFLTSITNVFKS